MLPFVIVATLVLGALLSVKAQAGASLIPLSATANAYQRGNAASNIVVEYVIDLTCSSCLDEWDTLNKVVDVYGSQVNFLYRVFPLPYHQQGFIVSKAAALVDYYSSDGSNDAVFTFMDTAFANQDQIYNSATADMTYNDVVKMVGTWAINGTGVSALQYAEGMNFVGGATNSDAATTIEMNTRYMFKYGGLHQSFATPLFSINGVSVMNLDTFEQWAATLDPLLAQSEL